MRKNQFHARVEPLERREVLSGVHAAAVSDTLSSFRARGNGYLISQQAIPDGSYQTISTIKGKSAVFGHFTGQLVIDYAPDQFRVKSGQAVLIDQSGNVFSTTFQGAFEVPRVGAAGTPGTFALNVVGGTGAYAGATGKGQIGIVRNLEVGYSRFTLHGTVQTQ